MAGPTTRTPCRRPARDVFVAAVLAAVCAVTVVTPTPAQPPTEPPVKKDDTTTGTPVPPPTADDPPADERPPLPPGEAPRPSVAVQYRIPSRDRRIFAQIQDGKPVQSEKTNAGEYAAWSEVVLFANQWEPGELDGHATRDLTYGDLTQPVRGHFRLDLLRFEGKLLSVTAVRPSRELADKGVAVMYQGWLVPADEPPANRLWVAFTELPPGFPRPELPEGKDYGPAVAVDRWAAFAGYFFKLAAYPGPDATDPAKPGDGWLEAPLLVGKSVTLLNEEPGRGIRPDKNLRIYKLIQDNSPIASEDRNWAEYAAWNRLILHARKFPAEELEANARADLGFADLFGEGRRDYKLELVKFTGNLRMLRRHEPGRKMREAGVAATYEGWLIPDGGHLVNPVCVVFSELPPGITVPAKAHDINRYVSFAGYSFKRLHYESGEVKKDDPNRNVVKAAPMLIGHTVVPRPDPTGTSPMSWTTFVGGALIVIVGVLGVAFGLSWWFRRGDRAARREVENVRGRNPFGEPAEQP